MKNEINETFELFKEITDIPELKDLIQEIQVLYNQKEELEQRINKAIEELEIWQPKEKILQEEKEYLLDILFY